MRTLLIVMTVVAVVVVVLQALGSGFVIGLANLLLVFGAPVCFVTAAIYSRGKRQTFFVGAACLAILMAADSPPPRIARGAELLLVVVNSFVAFAIAGGIAIATRGFIERHDWHHDPDDLDSWLDD